MLVERHISFSFYLPMKSCEITLKPKLAPPPGASVFSKSSRLSGTSPRSAALSVGYSV